MGEKLEVAAKQTLLQPEACLCLTTSGVETRNQTTTSVSLTLVCVCQASSPEGAAHQERGQELLSGSHTAFLSASLSSVTVRDDSEGGLQACFFQTHTVLDETARVCCPGQSVANTHELEQMLSLFCGVRTPPTALPAHLLMPLL